MPRPLLKFLFCLTSLLVLMTPFVGSAHAILLGLLFGLILTNPFLEQTKAWAPKLLSYAIIGLGAGIHLDRAIQAGTAGLISTSVGITITLILAGIFGKLLKQGSRLTALIGVGTAICGGSAIAAAAPVVRANDAEISVSLGIVFLLNSIALVLFPFLGRKFGLSDSEFGMWAALAIHDTSSVVGATLAFSHKALEIGTTVKLARALWIIPVTFVLALVWSQRAKTSEESQSKQPRKYPWFILGFLLMAALVSWFPGLEGPGMHLAEIAKRLMVLTLFFIGANLNLKNLKSVGFKPLLLGIILWVSSASLSLLAIRFELIPLMP